MKMSGLKFDNRKDPSACLGLDCHIFLIVRFKTGHLICMYKIFWPKFSICDLICHVYILFELVYNILQNKIQIWTFDSDNRIDLLREFNYVLGFYTDRSDIQLKFFYQIFSTSD